MELSSAKMTFVNNDAMKVVFIPQNLLDLGSRLDLGFFERSFWKSKIVVKLQICSMKYVSRYINYKKLISRS